MSESLSPAVTLRVRIGPYHDGKLKSRPIGTTVTCWVESFAEGTDLPVDVDGIMAAMVWLPATEGLVSQGQPAEVVKTGPGQWRVDILGDMVGTYTLVSTLVLPGPDPLVPVTEAGEIRFEITTAGNIQPLPAGGVPYAIVQAAATTAAVSAGYAAGRSAGNTSGAQAGAEAGAAAAIAPAREAAAETTDARLTERIPVLVPPEVERVLPELARPTLDAAQRSADEAAKARDAAIEIITAKALQWDDGALVEFE